MNGRNTFVAICFKKKQGAVGVSSLMYCLCQNGGTRVNGSFDFSVEPKRGDRHAFPVVFQQWYAETFEKWNLPKGRLPVVLGWGIETRNRLDSLLEHEDITLITQGFGYLDVRAHAVDCKQFKGIKPTDGWRKIASKIESLDPQFVNLSEPTPRALAEMFFAIENRGDVAVISKAFRDIARVIMADGIITTDEAKLLRSFISTLLDKQPRFNALASELDDILEDNVVDGRESRRLMRILADMRKNYGDTEISPA